MKEYWIVKPDDIKNISEDSLNFTDLAIFDMVITSKSIKEPITTRQIKWPILVFLTQLQNCRPLWCMMSFKPTTPTTA